MDEGSGRLLALDVRRRALNGAQSSIVSAMLYSKWQDFLHEVEQEPVAEASP